MKKNNSLTIYWAPSYFNKNSDENLFYPDPTNLFKELVENKEPMSSRLGFFNCPPVTDRLKKTFVFKNNIETKIVYDFNDIQNPKVFSEYGLSSSVYKPSSLINGSNIQFNVGWIFFAEDSADVLINPPMLHKTDLNLHATVLPARFDISKWFRPIPIEMQGWQKSGDFIIAKNDPLFYLEVLTDKKIELKRFELNDKLVAYARSCMNSPILHGANLPLVNRYKVFTETKTNKLVLNEIKKNLV
jgi:hypothetical protein